MISGEHIRWCWRSVGERLKGKVWDLFRGRQYEMEHGTDYIRRTIRSDSVAPRPARKANYRGVLSRTGAWETESLLEGLSDW